MPRHESSMLELGWAGRLGSVKTLRWVSLLGRHVRVQVELVAATQAMDTVLRATGYEDPCDWTGSYMKRTIGGLDVWSTHAYGTAIDLDYGGDNPDSPDQPYIDRNPYLRRPIVPGDEAFGTEMQLLEHQVRAIEDIRNQFGDPIWRWLGWSIGDTMHFQAAVRPEHAIPAEGNDMNYTLFRADEFDLWSDQNIIDAYDRGRFEDSNRPGFIQYWVAERDQRTATEKARFMTDYYARL